MIEITRHEITKDSSGNIKSLLIGTTFTNDLTGKSTYKETVFSINDFGGAVPTKLIVRAQIKEWLTKIPVFKQAMPDGTTNKIPGESVLQLMKKETQGKDSIIEFKKGEVGSLVGEAIQEV